ncbi:MAG: hypothetical protein AB7F67_19230 [Rhodospirillaceae bacterium]
MTLKRIVSETLVNTTTTGNQNDADVSGLLNGGFVVTWEGPDASSDGIYARLFGPDYRTVGGEFPLNATTAGNQADPVLAGLTGGGFVALWESPDGNDSGVYARRFTAGGAALNFEFLVNQTTTDQQDEVRVAALPNNGFVAVWESFLQDGSGFGIYMRRYGEFSPLSGESLVNTFTTNNQDDPDVAAFGDGSFVVAWESTQQASSTSADDIFAQRYDAFGNKFGPEFRVNTTTTSDQNEVAVEALDNGRFVFVWESFEQDGSGEGVFGRLYNADGSPATGEFQVNTFTTGDQRDPRVASLADGGFIVTWESVNQDGSGQGVYAQAYNADGTRDGAEFRVNAFTTSEQGNPAVARLNGTGAAVAWESFGQVVSNDIFVQSYAEPVPVWRFYNNANGVHFFTLSTAERDNVIATLPSFRFEGSNFAGANGPFADTAPVYRFYNTQNGAHFYTINEAEKNNVIATLPTFLFEGPNYNAYTAPVDGTVPLYRFYNVLTGAHFFTPNEAERANVVATLPEFRFEGVAYYVDPING